MAATAQQIIDAIDDAILARMTNGAAQRYAVGGVQLETYSLDELRNLREFYQRRANAARGPMRNFAKLQRPGASS